MSGAPIAELTPVWVAFKDEIPAADFLAMKRVEVAVVSLGLVKEHR